MYFYVITLFICMFSAFSMELPGKNQRGMKRKWEESQIVEVLPKKTKVNSIEFIDLSEDIHHLIAHYLPSWDKKSLRCVSQDLRKHTTTLLFDNSVHVQRNHNYDHLFAFRKMYPNLKKLTLRLFPEARYVFNGLSDGLEKNTTLISLCLYDSYLMDICLFDIAKALGKNTTLTELILAQSTVFVSGLIRLFEGVGKSTSLKTFSLEGNRITGSDTPYLWLPLAENTSITSFIFMNNTYDKDTIKINSRLYLDNPKFKEVKFLTLENGSMWPVSLSWSLEKNKTLQILKIDLSMTVPEEMEILAQALKKNTGLKKIFIHQNNLNVKFYSTKGFRELEKVKPGLELKITSGFIAQGYSSF